MPNTIYFPILGPERHTAEGIDITWTPSTKTLRIGGWYDSCVGIESTQITLAAFFAVLGITAKDCERVFVPKKPKTRKTTREDK